MALYGLIAGVALSFTSGWPGKKPKKASAPSSFNLQPQYTVALLVAGISLGASFIFRAFYGQIGDEKAWAMPPFPSSNAIAWHPPLPSLILSYLPSIKRWRHRRINGSDDRSRDTDGPDSQLAEAANLEALPAEGTLSKAATSPVMETTPPDPAVVASMSPAINPVTDLSDSTAESAGAVIAIAVLDPETTTETTLAAQAPTTATGSVAGTAALNPEATTTGSATIVTGEGPSASAESKPPTLEATLSPETTTLTSLAAMAAIDGPSLAAETSLMTPIALMDRLAIESTSPMTATPFLSPEMTTVTGSAKTVEAKGPSSPAAATLIPTLDPLAIASTSQTKVMPVTGPASTVGDKDSSISTAALDPATSVVVEGASTVAATRPLTTPEPPTRVVEGPSDTVVIPATATTTLDPSTVTSTSPTETAAMTPTPPQ
jgi:hypothetical protein